MNIRVADTVIKINTDRKYIKDLCRDYLILDGGYDFEIEITGDELERERIISKEIFLPEIIESTCIFRKICLQLLNYDGFFMHASVVELDGRAYAFSAKSGTGKSTHAQLWVDYFKGSAEIINGDKPFFRFINHTLYACGNPWAGKEGKQTNKMVPLKAICFLEQSPDNEIKRIGETEIIRCLFHQILMPSRSEQMAQLLDLLHQVIKQIPCYVLKCNISADAVRTAYEKMGRMEDLL